MTSVSCSPASTEKFCTWKEREMDIDTANDLLFWVLRIISLFWVVLTVVVPDCWLQNAGD